LPAPKTFAIANGMKVYLLEEHALPVVSASLVSMAGSEDNPKDKPGLAAFAARMLTEGTATRSSTQLANDIAQIGASLGSNAPWTALQ
jgi:zinc protease